MKKPIPDTSPFCNSAELCIISNPSRGGRNMLQHLPQGLSISTCSAGPRRTKVLWENWRARACCGCPCCNGFMGLNSRKLRLLGRGGDALKRWWCKVFTVSYGGRNSTHVPHWHPGREVQCLVVTALCWWMRWQGRICSYLRSFAKPWRRGGFPGVS